MSQTITGSPASILDMNLALFGLVPSNAVYMNQLGVIGENNVRLATYANQLTDANFKGASDNALATIVLNNILGISPANTQALAGAVTELLAAHPGNRGVVIYQLVQVLEAAADTPAFTAVASTWNERVSLGYIFSTTPGSIYMPVKGGPPTLPVVGRTFVLTTGVDNAIGLATDDVFVATEATLNAGDVLTGNGGNDQLRFASSGTTAISKTGFTTTGIQTLLVTSDTTGGTTMDTSAMQGLTTLINDNSSSNVTFSKIMSLAPVTLQNVSGGDTHLLFDTFVAGHLNDTMNLTLNNNKTIAGGSIGVIEAENIETFAITTKGGSSNIAALKSSTLEKVTVAGDQDLTLHQLVFFSPTPGSNTLDASALTGRLDVTLGSGGTPGNPTTVTGGHNVDTLRFSGNFADYQITSVAAGPNLAFTVHDQRITVAPVGDVHTTAVERLAFADHKGLAYDVAANQSAGKTVLMLGTALGTGLLKDASWVGKALAYFDHGATLQNGADLLLASGLVGAAAGGSSNATLVGWVWHNLFGNAPDAATLTALTAPLDNHSLTQVQWLAAVAGSDVAQQQVHLAGYAGTGLAFAV